MIRPIRDAAGLFHDEPDDLAAALEARGLRLIEPGRTGDPIGVLPYLEEEAIARLRHSVGPLGESESKHKRQNWDRWRGQWVRKARAFMLDTTEGPIDATTAYSAAEMLIRASDLRNAIECGQAERAAALAMMVASWVFIGGVSLRLAYAEPIATKYLKTQRANAKLERTTIGSDDGGTRKRDLVGRALQQAGSEAGTADVWGHLFSTLEGQGMAPHEAGAKVEREIHAIDTAGKPVIFTFKGVQTMLRQLRAGVTPPKRGRPRKKPA